MRNDVTLGAAGAPRLYVVSGSNMSGKSTFLRTIGVNVVLALAGGRVRSRSLTVSPMAIGATLRVQDSLEKGASRFYAEITRLQVIMQLARERDGRVLFLVDELLAGTNSRDRQTGGAAILQGLVARGAIGLATTHDLALAAVTDTDGPLSLGRLTRCDDGKVRYTMKRVIRGKQDLVMTGLELVEKLAVLVPPPRVNLVRYHGVFAPGSKLRALVVPHQADKPPAPVPQDQPALQRPLTRDGTSRIDWAALLKRVFQIDILACAKCGGRMKVLAVIDQPDVVTKILGHLGMPTVPEGIAPARVPPRQLDFDRDAA